MTDHRSPKYNKVPAYESLHAQVQAQAQVFDALSSSEGKLDRGLILCARYQSLVGALQLYGTATNTRPDIAFAVGYLCRAMGKPTPELHKSALRVLEYLYHVGPEIRLTGTS